MLWWAAACGVKRMIKWPYLQSQQALQVYCIWSRQALSTWNLYIFTCAFLNSILAYFKHSILNLCLSFLWVNHIYDILWATFFVMKDNMKCSICFKVDGEIENQRVRLCCEIESQPNLEQFKNTLWESSRQYASGKILYFDLFHFTNSFYCSIVWYIKVSNFKNNQVCHRQLITSIATNNNTVNTKTFCWPCCSLRPKLFSTNM